MSPLGPAEEYREKTRHGRGDEQYSKGDSGEDACDAENLHGVFVCRRKRSFYTVCVEFSGLRQA